MILKQRNIKEIVYESFALETEEAEHAGTVGYMARSLVQATMPHRKPSGHTFVRRNGDFTLQMTGHIDIGLPYGPKPRLIMVFLTNQALLKKNRDIELGDSMSAFLRQLGLVPTGGRWGSITAVKDQIYRLFTSSISCTYSASESEGQFESIAFPIADRTSLWWHPKNPDQRSLYTSSVRLGEQFFNEIVTNPVPVDMNVLRSLRGSAMALDVYCWLTYRMSYLGRRTLIPWASLEAQFGSDYTRTRAFKASLVKNIKRVLEVYPAAHVVEHVKGLELHPSATHVRNRQPRAGSRFCV